jgi:hypothetical protein
MARPTMLNNSPYQRHTYGLRSGSCRLRDGCILEYTLALNSISLKSPSDLVFYTRIVVDFSNFSNSPASRLVIHVVLCQQLQQQVYQ